MGLRLRPVEHAFYELFTESASHLLTGTALLAEMLAEGAEEADHAEIAGRMREAEHAADETTHAIVRRVNSTFVTPFDREDIYALAAGLDDVMDQLEAVVDRIALYRVKVLPAELSLQVDVLQRCAEITAAAMPGLKSMHDLSEYWIEINRLENVGDANHRALLAHLFSGQFKAMEVLKLKDVVESLEAAINAFERVAAIVEQIAVKES